MIKGRFYSRMTAIFLAVIIAVIPIIDNGFTAYAAEVSENALTTEADGEEACFNPVDIKPEGDEADPVDDDAAAGEASETTDDRAEAGGEKADPGTSDDRDLNDPDRSKTPAGGLPETSAEDWTWDTYTTGSKTCAKITKYIGSDTDVVIPSELGGYQVEQIYNYAFKDNKTIETVVFPDPLQEIKGNAFYGCSSLRRVTYSKSLETMPSSTIYGGCDSLTEIIIPDGMETIPLYAFLGAEHVTAMSIPDSVKTIKGYAFRGMKSLTSIDIPDSVTSIGTYVFAECSNLEEVDLPDDLTTIGNYAFSKCTSLKRATIPDKVETVPASGFSGCTSLEQIIFGRGITTIKNYAFCNCSALEEVTLPSGLTAMENNAFQNCSSLKSMNVPGSIGAVPSNAFDGCTSLRQAELKDGITKINGYAFKGCTALHLIRLPGSIIDQSKIVSTAFNNANPDMTVECPEGSAAETWAKEKGYAVAKKKTIDGTEVTLTYVVRDGKAEVLGCGAVTEGDTVTGTLTIPATLPDGNDDCPVISIADLAFSGIEGLTDVTVPDGVSAIGSETFKDCTGLTDLTLPSSVASIGEDALSGCDVLTVHCDRNSFAARYCLSHGVSVELMDTVTNEEAFLDQTGNEYTLNTELLSITGELSLSVKYRLRSDTVPEDAKVKIDLPDNQELTVSPAIDGTAAEYEVSNGKISIPVNNASGTITFRTVPLYHERRFDFTSSAALSYSDAEGVEKDEVIGIVQKRIKGITLFSPDTTKTPTVSVNGIASPDAEVRLFVGGSEAGTLTADSAGKYLGSVTIPEPVDGEDYLITATFTEDSEEYSAYAEVTYRSVKPSLDSFTMYVNGNMKNPVDLLGKDTVSRTINPQKEMSFMAGFTDREMLDEVYVVGKNEAGEEYSMPASYDEESGAYVASGYFEDSHTFIPRNISIRVTYKTPEFRSSSARIDKWKDEDDDYIQAGLTASDFTATEEAGSDKVSYRIDMSKAGNSPYGKVIAISYEIIDPIKSKSVWDKYQNYLTQGSYILGNDDDPIQFKSLDMDDEATYYLLAKTVVNDVEQIAKLNIKIDGVYGRESALKEYMNTFTTASRFTDLAYSFKKAECSYNDMVEKINAMKGITDEEREQKLAMARELMQDKMLYAFAKKMTKWAVNATEIATPEIGIILDVGTTVFNLLVDVVMELREGQIMAGVDIGESEEDTSPELVASGSEDTFTWDLYTITEENDGGNESIRGSNHFLLDVCASRIMDDYTGGAIPWKQAIRERGGGEINILYLTGSEYIGANLFQGLKLTDGFELPGSVERIGENAFAGTYIGGSRFEIGSGVEEIGKKAFANGGISAELVISSGGDPLYIGDEAFAGNNFAGDLKIPARVAYDWNYTSSARLENAQVIVTNKIIPVKGIGTGVFRNSYKKSDEPGYYSHRLIIEDDVNYIGALALADNAFEGEIDLPESMEIIDRSAFEGCSGFYGDLEIPDTTWYIGGSAFKGCSGLSGVDLPDGFTYGSLGQYAFSECTGIESIKFPTSFKPGAQAHKDFPTLISKGAFSGCSKLTEVYTEEAQDADGDDISIPVGSIEIPDEMFKGCDLVYFDFPNSVKKIGADAFADNTRLQLEALPPYIEVIGGGANSNGVGGHGAFQNCSMLNREIVIPATCNTIGANAFNDTNVRDVILKGATNPVNVNMTVKYSTGTVNTPVFGSTDLVTVHCAAAREDVNADGEGNLSWYGYRVQADDLEPVTGIIVDNDVQMVVGQTLDLRDYVHFLPENATDRSLKFSGGYGLALGYYAPAYEDTANQCYNGRCTALKPGVHYVSVQATGADPSDYDLISYIVVTVKSEGESFNPLDGGSCGQQGDNIGWEITGERGDRTLTIYGNGRMKDFDASTSSEDAAPWSEYSDIIRHIVISDGVTYIGDYAFTSMLDGLNSSVVIPASVTGFGLQSLNGYFGDDPSDDETVLPGRHIYFFGKAPALKSGDDRCFGYDTILHFRKANAGWTAPTWKGYKTIDESVKSVSSVRLNNNSLVIHKGESEQLIVTVEPSSALNKGVTWSSSDNDTAAVDQEGKVTAKKSGKALIYVTADDGGLTDICEITVDVPLQSLTISDSALVLKKGETAILSVTGFTPSDATSAETEWVSSYPSIVKVDKNTGLVTALKTTGSDPVEVICRAKNWNVKASCMITVFQPGWVNEGDGWHYYAEYGVRSKGWLNTGGSIYYLDENGNRVTGKSGISRVKPDISGNAVRDGSGNPVYETGYYYFNRKGVMQTGWISDGTGKHYYDPMDGGAMARNTWTGEGKNRIYVDENGDRHGAGSASVNGAEYYFDSNGQVKTGWIKVSDKWYYFNPAGENYGAKIKVDAGLGAQQYIIGGKTYLVDEDGARLTGWQDEYAYEHTTVSGNGETVTETVTGYHKYYDINGVMITGWKKIGSDWYYFYPAAEDGENGHEIGDKATGLVVVDGKLYSFGDDGKRASGGETVTVTTKGSDGQTTSTETKTNRSGVVKTDKEGFVSTSSGDVYVASGGKAVTDAWVNIGDTQVRVGSDGRVQTGRAKVDGKVYEFDADGKVSQILPTGWVTEGDKSYYYDENGVQQKDKVVQIGKKLYSFDGNGELMTSGLYERVEIDDGNGNKSVSIRKVTDPGKGVSDAVYLIKDDGTLYTGWYTDPDDAGKQYYFSADNGAKLTGAHKIGTERYYFDTVSGGSVRSEGWIDEAGAGEDGYHRYYVSSKGTLQTGWLKIENAAGEVTAKYYLGKDGERRDGVIKAGTKLYYQTAEGIVNAENAGSQGGEVIAQTNGKAVIKMRQNDKDVYTAVNNKGVIQTGWQTIGGSKYYFDKTTGCALTGYQQVKGIWYDFAADGKLK